MGVREAGALGRLQCLTAVVPGAQTRPAPGKRVRSSGPPESRLNYNVEKCEKKKMPKKLSEKCSSSLLF